MVHFFKVDIEQKNNAFGHGYGLFLFVALTMKTGLKISNPPGRTQATDTIEKNRGRV